MTPLYAQAPAKAQQEPLKVVTMYAFEPHELAKIKETVKNARVDIVICKSRDEFKAQLKDAEVVYGDIKGNELDFAPKLKWIQAGGAGTRKEHSSGASATLTQTPLARAASATARFTARSLVAV